MPWEAIVGIIVIGILVYAIVRAAMAATGRAAKHKAQKKILEDQADAQKKADEVGAEPLPDSAADAMDELSND